MTLTEFPFAIFFAGFAVIVSLIALKWSADKDKRELRTQTVKDEREVRTRTVDAYSSAAKEANGLVESVTISNEDVAQLQKTPNLPDELKGSLVQAKAAQEELLVSVTKLRDSILETYEAVTKGEKEVDPNRVTYFETELTAVTLRANTMRRSTDKTKEFFAKNY